MDERELLDLLPTGVLIIDDVATVRLANRPILDLLGWPHEGYEGRSLLDHVLVDDLGHAAEIMAEGHAFPGRIMGPIRLRYADGDGRERVANLWARELPDGDGYLVVSPEESAGELLSDAIRGVAVGAPLDRILPLIVHSCLAHPIGAPACLLGIEDGLLHPLTPWPLDDAGLIRRRATPWELAGRSGVVVEVTDVEVLEPDVRRSLARLGTGSVWCRPVETRDGDVRGVLCIFRGTDNPPSANQRRWLDDIASVAALAFDQHEYRTHLEQAAFTDPLTGAATRARLHERIELGIESATVFYIDLDGFKEVNDVHGHVAGDAVLAGAVERMAELVDDDDLIIRLGGDEFVVLGTPRAAADAERLAAELVEALAEPYHVDGAGLDAPATVGVGFQAPGTAFDEALLAADEALAEAKRAGKRRYRLATRDTAPTGTGHGGVGTVAPMRVEVDTDRCQGHNRCYALAPELFDVDDYGTAVVVGDGTVPPDLEEKARLAVANCPEYAITLVEGTVVEGTA